MDLRLVFEGTGSMVSGGTLPAEGRRIEMTSGLIADLTASLARHCSLFLRKMVLGDRHTQRLLDGEVCCKEGLKFGRIRQVSGERVHLSLTPFTVKGGRMHATKLNDETGDPEVEHILPIAPQSLNFHVEWPLPGMVSWGTQPMFEVRPEELFDSHSPESLDCESWLGQQLVVFDGRGITLRDVIRVMVNVEGAHSPPVERLMLVEGQEDTARFRVVKDSEIHILGHLRTCGIRYSHLIVFQTAMYLYNQLAQKGSPSPVLCLEVPDDVFSSAQAWLRFDGGLAMSFGTEERTIRHRIRAPK